MRKTLWYEKPCDIIIPTWNSMPEFELCLKSIFKCIPTENRGRIIVVDKGSIDGTFDCAMEYGCNVFVDSGNLGSARLTGLNYASSDWIMFIDSDIEVSYAWFNEMIVVSDFIEKTKYNPGWFFGRTIDDIEPLHSEKIYKCTLDFDGIYDFHLVNGRAYTHNTICLRKPLLGARIRDVNSWEDYLLACEMRKHGYDVCEVNVQCTQHRGSTYQKNGMYTEAWSQIGLLDVQGLNFKNMFRPFWFPWWGLKCSIHFGDLSHLWYNIKVCESILHACLDKKRYGSGFKRGAIL